MILENKKYLKTAEVFGGETITFKSEGEWVQSKKFTYEDGTPKNDFVIKVEILSVEKDMRLNKTNRDVLIAAYGKDTAKWIGQTAIINKVKAMVAGKMQDMIILEVADGINSV